MTIEYNGLKLRLYKSMVEMGRVVDAPDGVTISWNKDAEIGKGHKFNME